MTTKTSGDSSLGVSGNIFSGIQDSFTTQGLRRNRRFPVPRPRILGAEPPRCQAETLRRPAR
jgi:hypothetical protein